MTTDGGSTWVLQNALMPGATTGGAPFNQPGVNTVYYSADGSQVWATSFKLGYWHLQRGGSWEWVSTEEYVTEMFPHPTRAKDIAVTFRSEGCYNRSAVFPCKSILRVYSNFNTFAELSSQVIQVAWSTIQPDTIFFSEHYDALGSYLTQTWYNSTLQRVVLTGSQISQKVQLMDHQSGLAYRAGVLLVAVRVKEDSNQVHLYTSDDDGVTALSRVVFRDFFDDEIPTTSFNILDLTGGSIFINVRGDRNDRGDLFFSSSLERDFQLVLPNNVRGGALADFTRIASLRGIYMANAFVPPGDEVVTGISYDNGANWDLIKVPPELAGRCNNSDGTWCGMHFLARSASEVGQAPYSATGAIGLVMATGNVGHGLNLDTPDQLSTFLSRDGGVNWKQIAAGNNLFAMADRGAVLLWAPARVATSNFSWSFDEGKTSDSCLLGALGTQTVHAVLSAPSIKGLRFLLLTERDRKHYAVMVDFSNLADTKCTGEDVPDTTTSSYETWTAKDPDGEQGCLLGSKTTYVRRKPNVKCFNADADIQHDTINCTCEREDYECDDGYSVQQFWVPNSPCTPKAGTFQAGPNPCAGGARTYFETRGYRRVAFDTCTQGSNDQFAPVEKQCVNGNTQGTNPTVTQTTVSPTTQSSGAGTTGTTGTTSGLGTTATTVSPTTTPAPGSNSNMIVAVVLVVLVLGGLVAAFLVLRRNPAFVRRFGGKIPFVPKPESDPYSTLGELETGNNNFDEDF